MSLKRNNMLFIDFQRRLANHVVFSLMDARKVSSGFSYRQMDRWEKKGYLKKIKRGFYCLSSQNIDQNFLFFAANKIYAPSYVSLEAALKHYSIIPEEIFQITSVGTRKTAGFRTPIGNFGYRRIKPELFFGYRLMDFGMQKILFAEPEKAILDYIYIHAEYKTIEDFEAMRINVDEFQSRMNLSKLQKYLENFHNKQLSRRVKIFLSAIHS